MPFVFGYARVSTAGQTLEAQVAQLEAAGAGVGGGKVNRKKVSRAAREQPQPAKLLNAFYSGHVVLVTRLDRLDRFMRDLFKELAAIAAKKAAFRSFSDPWDENTTPHGGTSGV